jgi:hypothetical protein
MENNTYLPWVLEQDDLARSGIAPKDGIAKLKTAIPRTKAIRGLNNAFTQNRQAQAYKLCLNNMPSLEIRWAIRVTSTIHWPGCAKITIGKKYKYGLPR